MNFNVIKKDTGIVGAGQGIIFVNGKYYLLSESPAKVCVSEDLENWTEYQLNSSYLKPRNIAYGNGVFVVTGVTSTNADTWFYRSIDGLNWTPVKINTGLSYSINSNSVKFINNKFVALLGIYWYKTVNNQEIRTKTENWFYESTDGTIWTKHELVIESNENLDQMDIEYTNGLYVRVGCSGSIYTSYNLNDWTRRNSGTSSKLVGITYGKGQFVITGDNGIILTSTDGITWYKQESGTNSYLIRSRYANGMYIAVGYNGTILQSIDGKNWINLTPNATGLRYGLAYNNIDNIMVITSYYFESTKTIPIYYFKVSRDLGTEDNENSTLFFFNTELELQGVIDYFISLRWRKKYFEAGEFEIVLPVTEYVMRFLATDIIVMRNNYTEAGIIETIEFSDNGTDEEVTISGRFLSSILDRRIIKSKINFTGRVIEGMNTIVNAMTPLTTAWETESVSMSSPSITFQATYKNVYTYLCKLSSYSNIGFRVVPNVDSKVFMFEVWQGKDRTDAQNINERYAFSDDNYNIEQASCVISNKTIVNYVLTGGTGEDTDRVLVTTDKGASGFDLHEVFNDQKGLSNNDLTADKYKEVLLDSGESKINENGTFTLEVTATDRENYKSKWSLGDIVNIKKEKWGINTSYRIVEVEEIIEDGKKTIYPTFGSPLSTAWEDDE